jgi:hypothetical protein
MTAVVRASALLHSLWSRGARVDKSAHNSVLEQLGAVRRELSDAENRVVGTALRHAPFVPYVRSLRTFDGRADLIRQLARDSDREFAERGAIDAAKLNARDSARKAVSR